jgi:hypothetical protein
MNRSDLPTEDSAIELARPAQVMNWNVERYYRVDIITPGILFPKTLITLSIESGKKLKK